MNIFLKSAGIICIVISLFFIITERANYNYNRDNPWSVMMSGYKGSAYSYLPPFTGHELGILFLGGVGIFLLFMGIADTSDEDDENGGK
jgi:hypothetical protein